MPDNPRSLSQTTPRVLYQNDAPKPIEQRTKLVPVRVSATCGVCGEGELTSFMDGGNAWLHGCSKCDVQQWLRKRYPRMEYDVAEDQT